MTTNIFDTNDLSDLPDDIKATLKCNKKDDFSDKIMSLYDDTVKELNIDQITVGLFRKFKYKTRRKILNTKLYNMTKKSKLQRVAGKKGVFRHVN